MITLLGIQKAKEFVFMFLLTVSRAVVRVH
jgi:hypothetical protein